MTLKRLFFLKNHKNRAGAGDTRELPQFTQHAAWSRHFSGKRNFTTEFELSVDFICASVYYVTLKTKRGGSLVEWLQTGFRNGGMELNFLANLIKRRVVKVRHQRVISPHLFIYMLQYWKGYLVHYTLFLIRTINKNTELIFAQNLRTN